ARAAAGCTAGSRPGAGTWAAAIRRRTGTRPSTSGRASTRSCARSSRVRTGAGATSTRSRSDAARAASLRERLVDELHADRALADGGGDALHVARADVADGDDAGHARLEQVGRALERPFRGCEVADAQVGPGLHEPLGVPRDALAEPGGVRLGPGHQEDVPDRAGLLAGRRAAPAHLLEVILAREPHDLGARAQRDARVLLDAPDQV